MDHGILDLTRLSERSTEVAASESAVGPHGNRRLEVPDRGFRLGALGQPQAERVVGPEVAGILSLDPLEERYRVSARDHDMFGEGEEQHDGSLRHLRRSRQLVESPPVGPIRSITYPVAPSCRIRLGESDS